MPGDHQVTFLDIAFDDIPELLPEALRTSRYFSSRQRLASGHLRSPLGRAGGNHTPAYIMCSYKFGSRSNW
uniref:Uncharacterized protein n=1 Tax=Sphaerodactylus townsendi TaxID=933632 RepID=A0ACB8FKK5_9SAUR